MLAADCRGDPHAAQPEAGKPLAQAASVGLHERELIARPIGERIADFDPLGVLNHPAAVAVEFGVAAAPGPVVGKEAALDAESFAAHAKGDAGCGGFQPGVGLG